MSRDFQSIATSLELALREFYAGLGRPLTAADELTIQTNSTFVARRGQPLVDLLIEARQRSTLEAVKILDVGSGFGALALYFAAKGAEVRGLDPHDERFAVGQAVGAQHGLAVSFDAGYIEDVTYPDASFDAVVMNNSLCYIVERGDRRQALAQVLRVLRPGGFFIVRDPNRLHPIDQFTRIPLIQLLPPKSAERVGRALRGHRSRVRLTTISGARRELQGSGFVDVKSHGFVSRPWKRPLSGLARYYHQIARKTPSAQAVQTMSSPR